MLTIYIVNDDDEIVLEEKVTTNNIPMALSLYEEKCGEFEHLEYTITE